MLRRVVWLLLPALLIPGAILGAPAELHVAAASSCAPALTEIGQAFEKQGSAHVVFSFGSSGLLARQISHGAPFDVFVAAEPAPVAAEPVAGGQRHRGPLHHPEQRRLPRREPPHRPPPGTALSGSVS